MPRVLSVLVTLISLAIGLVLLFAAIETRDPYLLPWRPSVLPVLVTIGLGGLAISALRLASTPTVARLALLLLWVAVPMLALLGETRFQLQRQAVLTADQPEDRLLGQHFIVGYGRLEDVRPLVERDLVGGIFIAGRNIAGRPVTALRDEIALLQGIRTRAGLPPLIVATDQEGGIVSRLSPPLPRLAPLATLASLPGPERMAAAHAYGVAHGRDLAALGITMNFAPVADLRVERPDNPLDFHSLIGRRAISGNPHIAAEIALGYAQGLEAENVMPTVKHFPGLGGIATDTHHFSAALATPVADLAARDWLPFRTVLAGSGAALMVGHVTVAAIDPDRPASQSRRVVDVIRGDWRYQGPIVTDDLTMGAVYRHGLCEAVVGALNAGIDLLLVSWDGDQYYRAMDCALKARAAGKLSPDMLAASRARLLQRRS